jgi:serine/threonine protein kinase
MPRRRPSPVSDRSEEERALLQNRVALFWKVIFFILLIGSALGGLGAVKKPGVDLLLTLAATAGAGLLWWLCRRGKRSIRFSRAIDAGGVLLFSINGALLGRYLLAGFAREHAIATGQATTMADAFVAMLQLETMAIEIAIRAALVPSRPRRTAVITALFGVPTILATALLVPTAHGLTWRALDSDASPWLPATLAMMWGFAVVACTVISSIIYGLRAEVREARRFGQYVLERKIGEGATGVVYRATHAMLRRPAAIKLLLKDRASEIDLARFEREVQLTSRLVHPNTISIFDYGRTAEGVFYYVMEYLDGIDLQRLVDQYGPVEPARAIHIVAQISGALAEAHALGLIHRDIKPANIVLTERPDEPDVVKVVDFGLVKNFGGSLAESAATNAIIGTPLYMAPEAISQPDAVDGRADLYAVGAVAYFLLTGRHVFEAASVLEICSKHMLEAPVPPSQRLGKPLPADLEAIVLGCLAKDRDARPASAAALRTRLLACVDAGRKHIPAARAWWQAHRASQQDIPPFVDPADPAGSRPPTMAIDRSGRGTEALRPAR